MSLTPRAGHTPGPLGGIFHQRANHHTFLQSHSEYSHQAQDLKTQRPIQQSSQRYIKKSYTGTLNQQIQLSPQKSNRSHQAFEIKNSGLICGHCNGNGEELPISPQNCCRHAKNPHIISSGRNLAETGLGHRSTSRKLDLSKFSNYETLRADRNTSHSSIEA